MASGVTEIPYSDLRGELEGKMTPLLDELARLLSSPRRRFSSLAKNDVPETTGLYVIYQEEPREVFYAGKARARAVSSKWSPTAQHKSLEMRTSASLIRGAE